MAKNLNTVFFVDLERLLKDLQTASAVLFHHNTCLGRLL
jgi:hypothetical protein